MGALSWLKIHWLRRWAYHYQDLVCEHNKKVKSIADHREQFGREEVFEASLDFLIEAAKGVGFVEQLEQVSRQERDQKYCAEYRNSFRHRIRSQILTMYRLHCERSAVDRGEHEGN